MMLPRPRSHQAVHRLGRRVGADNIHLQVGRKIIRCRAPGIRR